MGRLYILEVDDGGAVVLEKSLRRIPTISEGQQGHHHRDDCYLWKSA